MVFFFELFNTTTSNNLGVLVFLVGITIADRIKIMLEVGDKSKFKRDFKDASNTVDRESKGMRRAVEDFASSAKAAYAAVGVAVAAVLTATIALAKEVAGLGDSYQKMSLRTGLATETLSTMSFAAERSGTSIQDLEIGVRRLARNVLDAEKGTGKAADAFKALGIDIKDSNGQLKSQDQLIFELADTLGQMENSTRQAALAQEIFGRAGVTLLPLLSEGSEGIKELQQRARDLGVEFSTDLANDSAAFEDAMLDVDEAIKGVKITLSETLIPAITKFTNNVLTPGITKVNSYAKALREMKEAQEGTAGALENSAQEGQSDEKREQTLMKQLDRLGDQLRRSRNQTITGVIKEELFALFGATATRSEDRINQDIEAVKKQLEIVRASIASNNRQAEDAAEVAVAIRNTDDGQSQGDIKSRARGAIGQSEVDALFGVEMAGDDPRVRGLVTGHGVKDGRSIKLSLEPKIPKESKDHLKDSFAAGPVKMGEAFDATMMRMNATLSAFGVNQQGMFSGIFNVRAGLTGLGVGQGEGSSEFAKKLLSGLDKFGAAGQVFSGAVGIFQGVASLLGGTKVSGDFAGMSTEELQRIVNGDLGQYSKFQDLGDEAVDMFKKEAGSELSRRGINSSGSQRFGGVATATSTQVNVMQSTLETMRLLDASRNDLLTSIDGRLANIEFHVARSGFESRPFLGS